MSDDRVDLSNCDEEPIHIPGAIQPHGALVAVRRPGLTISHASANLGAFFGVDPGDAIGRDLGSLVDAETVARIVNALADPEAGSSPFYLLTVRSSAGDATYDAIAHRAGEGAIIEFEPARDHAGDSVAELYRLTQQAVTRLRKADSLAAMYDACARSVREISGFDRVMIYRFDTEWNGTVIAEAKREDLEPFLGLHYPASDIPSQARELYARNWLRFIADRSYAPVPIGPASGPNSRAPLDLSHSVLRSVSPIHLEYLANMGVGASMSISLLKGERLWGLVACHHCSPRYVPYDIRTACELLGQVMSLQLVTREQQDLSGYGVQMKAVGSELARKVERAEDIGLILTGGAPTLLDFLDSNGAALVVGEQVTRIGQTPGVEKILEISDWLSARGGEVFSTDHLGRIVELDGLSAVSAGLMAITIAEGLRFQVLWFRPEQVRTVNWAGDPSKSLAKGQEGVRLSPRGSFALWKQTLRGRSVTWTEAEVAAALDFRREVAAALLRRGEEVARQNRDLKWAGAEVEMLLDSERAARGQAEKLNRMKDEFVATLSHELRTPLNAILGWAQILRHSAADPMRVIETVEVIERNARVQVKMIEDLLDISRITSGKLRLEMIPVNLAAVVEDALATIAPAAAAKGIRVDRIIDPLHGLTISGDPDRLQQVVWNLLSNAVKFTPKGGRVQVILERINSHVEISVADSGQGIDPAFLPHVFDRFRQEDASTNRRHGGLGLGLAIVRHLVELHGGAVFVESEGEGRGASFIVSLPIRALSRPADRRGDHPAHLVGEAEEDTLDLQAVRALIVDDEPDARELIRRVLTECGVAAVTAGSAEEALSLFRQTPFDVVVSDIGMPVVDGYAFIERLRQSEAELGRPKTPAVALTAYARPEDRRRIMLAGYQIHLAKPVEPSEITAVVANLVGRV